MSNDIPPNVKIEQIEFIPEDVKKKNQRTKHQWLRSRVKELKPGSKPLKITFPDRKQTDVARDVLVRVRKHFEESPGTNKTWEFYKCSLNGNTNGPYNLYIECIPFNPNQPRRQTRRKPR